MIICHQAFPIKRQLNYDEIKRDKNTTDYFCAQKNKKKERIQVTFKIEIKKEKNMSFLSFFDWLHYSFDLKFVIINHKVLIDKN